MALGYANDEVERLENAIAYLWDDGIWTDTDTRYYQSQGEQHFYGAWTKVVGYGRLTAHKNRWQKYGLPPAASWFIFELRGITECQMCGGAFDFDHPKGLGLLSPVLEHTIVDGRPRIRGVVHQKCNALIGNARHDVMTLVRLMDYLEQVDLLPLEKRHQHLLEAYVASTGGDFSHALRTLATRVEEV